MFQFIKILPLLSLLHSGNAAPAPSLFTRQDTGCSAYTIINTRGTTEPQAESSGFITMNKAIRSAIPGVETYNTVYPADSSQTSSVGTEDIISHITSVLSSDPGHCFVLEGYSQGAKSTVQAMPSLTGEMFDAVKAVFLIGNPYHKAGLACNVDIEGGGSTLNVDGKSLTAGNAIPDNWVGKTMDVCNKGDGVCDTTNGQKEITGEHTAYQGNIKMQNLGADFVIKAFNAVSTPATSPAGQGGSASASASTTAIDANSTTESVLALTSIGPVAYTVPYPSAIESTSASASSSSATESILTSSSESAVTSFSKSGPASSPETAPTSSSEPIPAPTSETTSAPTSEVDLIPTSVPSPAGSSPASSPESSPASSSASSAVLPSASSIITDIAESPSTQSVRPTRTRCQPRPTQP